MVNSFCGNRWNKRYEVQKHSSNIDRGPDLSNAIRASVHLLREQILFGFTSDGGVDIVGDRAQFDVLILMAHGYDHIKWHIFTLSAVIGWSTILLW